VREIIEAAMVGKDGMVGAFAALDGISVNRGIVQLSGTALTCKTSELRSAVLQSQSLLSTLFRHEQTLYAQASQSAACMAAHGVEERLCRWLLRARDLTGSDSLHFTQEFLAEMLGVKRTSVTLHARTLQQAGMINIRGAKYRSPKLKPSKKPSVNVTGPSNPTTMYCSGHTRRSAFRRRPDRSLCAPQIFDT
jgi:Mn-dependent DtxR family transcriptional regulator